MNNNLKFISCLIVSALLGVCISWVGGKCLPVPEAMGQISRLVGISIVAACGLGTCFFILADVFRIEEIKVILDGIKFGFKKKRH